MVYSWKVLKLWSSVLSVLLVVRTDSLKGRRGRLPSKPKNLPDHVTPVNITASLVKAHIDSNPAVAKLDYSRVRKWNILFSENMRNSFRLQSNDSPFSSLTYYSFQYLVPGRCEEPVWKGERRWHQAVLWSPHRDHGGYPEMGWGYSWILHFLSWRPGASAGGCICWAFHTEISIQVRISTRVLWRVFLIFWTEIWTECDLFLSLCYFRSNPEEHKLIFCNGVVLHRSQCVRGFGDWIDSIMDFSQSLHRLSLDITSFSCLAALVIITGEKNIIKQ